ncbi:hypothetical protein E2C01_089992 [Portunus trituberculatus]|uniref:Uncharacterized protein n=1 Tax=Portunus trituberculatus TaxID=210409 RepID=A0A5B7JKR3_PORTR|nr:hypothetical protein [Portunus trituberculatus]
MGPSPQPHPAAPSSVTGSWN